MERFRATASETSVLSQHAESRTTTLGWPPDAEGMPAGAPATVPPPGATAESVDTSTTTPVGSPPPSGIRVRGGQWIHVSSRSSGLNTSAYHLSADSNRHRVRRAHAIASAGL